MRLFFVKDFKSCYLFAPLVALRLDLSRYNLCGLFIACFFNPTCHWDKRRSSFTFELDGLKYDFLENEPHDIAKSLQYFPVLQLRPFSFEVEPCKNWLDSFGEEFGLPTLNKVHVFTLHHGFDSYVDEILPLFVVRGRALFRLHLLVGLRLIVFLSIIVIFVVGTNILLQFFKDRLEMTVTLFLFLCAAVLSCYLSDLGFLFLSHAISKLTNVVSRKHGNFIIICVSFAAEVFIFFIILIFGEGSLFEILIKLVISFSSRLESSCQFLCLVKSAELALKHMSKQAHVKRLR